MRAIRRSGVDFAPFPQGLAFAPVPVHKVPVNISAQRPFSTLRRIEISRYLRHDGPGECFSGPTPTEVSNMATGTVKWFNTTKGFGFIQPNDGGTDVFVHISAVERAGLGSLNEGQTVTYELERDQRSGKTSAGQLQVQA